MSLSKYRMKLPKLEPEECRGVAMKKVLEDIEYSKNCLVVFEPHQGPVELLFTGLNEGVLASLIVPMTYHKQLHQFFKMAVIAADRLAKHPEKGMEFYEQACKFVRENFSHPEDLKLDEQKLVK